MIVQCELCPKGCIIEPGQSGECRVRVNIDGKLTAVTYGYPCTVHIDPIEKKPLYHFLPATATFSLATVGCNLHCKNCQNWEISQENPENIQASFLPPDKIAAFSKREGCASVSFTYTEPSVYYEYALDSCIAAHEAGIKTILVTAGYLNPEPVKKLYQHVDAARIDIKSMSEEFYRDICSATLAPVLNTCVQAKGLGCHIEIIHLVIPTLNDTDDGFKKLAKWIVENLGKETPLHFSRFFPQYNMRHLPPTPDETLDRACAIAKSEGILYFYQGNVQNHHNENTVCPKCGQLLIERVGYRILQNTLSNGKCPACGTEIYGVWS
ncbi:MAG TPA: AmmeMemoRadiSam system radical SAM enzyme [Candidatus Hydrogenedentes bacterium]|nr:AmmeMemoRadiSam system radical SAM enzyme [Candidatus Hydrogenedentota bacterium]